MPRLGNVSDRYAYIFLSVVPQVEEILLCDGTIVVIVLSIRKEDANANVPFVKITRDSLGWVRLKQNDIWEKVKQHYFS